MALSKELARQLANPEKVLIKNIPHLDEDVWVQPLSGPGRLDYLTKHLFSDELNGVEKMFDLVAKCVVDEHGTRIYEDDQLDMLAGLNLGSVRFIAEKISTLMGLNLEDAEENS